MLCKMNKEFDIIWIGGVTSDDEVFGAGNVELCLGVIGVGFDFPDGAGGDVG